MKRYLFCVPADFLLVFTALYGAVFSLVTTFDLTERTDVLLMGAVGASLVFTLIFSMDRSVWRNLLGVAAAVGVCALVALRWETVKLGTAGIVQLIWDLLADDYGFVPIVVDISATIRETEKAVVDTLLILTTVLGCYLAWGLVSLRTFWAEALVTLAFLAPALALTMVPAHLPLAALLVFYCVGGLTRLAGREDAVGRAKLLYAGIPLCLALVIAVGAVVPAGSYVRPDWINQRRADLLDAGMRVVEGAAEGDLDSLIQTITSIGEGGVSLSSAGPLNYSGSTVLEVTGSYTGRVYLRGRSYGSYTGTRWTALDDKLYETYLPSREGGRGENDWETIAGYQPMAFPNLTQDGVREQVQVRYSTLGEHLYTPYHLALEQGGGEVTGGAFRRDEYMTRTPGYRLFSFTVRSDVKPIQYGWRIDPETGYSVVSGLPGWRRPAEREGAAAAEEEYRALVYRAYTELPDGYDADRLLEDLYRWNARYGGGLVVPYSILSAVEEDGEITYTEIFPSWQEVMAGREPDRQVYELWPGQEPDRDVLELLRDGTEVRLRADPVRMARYVAYYLARRCVYDADTPRTPEGVDYVSYFLNSSKRGYCMHFASAATVLLRAMGVPARYTTGYVADMTAGETVLVSDYASHAWVEVYIYGYGWEPVEVTAGFDGRLPWEQETTAPAPTPTPEPTRTPAPTRAPQPETTPETLEPEETPSAGTPRPTISPRPTLSPDDPGDEPEETGDLTWLLRACAAAGIAGGLAALVWLRRRWVVWRRKRRFADPTTNRAVLNAYRDLERILRSSGAEMDPGLLALAKKAKFSQHTLTEEERDGFLAGVSAAAREAEAALPRWRRPLFRFVHGGWLK